MFPAIATNRRTDRFGFESSQTALIEHREIAERPALKPEAVTY